MIVNDFVTFCPSGSTVNIAATTTTANVALTISAGTSATGVRPQVRVFNSGTNPIFLAFGNSAVTALTTTGIPVAGGGTAVFTVPAQATHVAAIYGTGTGTVYFTSGFGAI